MSPRVSQFIGHLVAALIAAQGPITAFLSGENVPTSIVALIFSALGLLALDRQTQLSSSAPAPTSTAAAAGPAAAPPAYPPVPIAAIPPRVPPGG